MPQLPIPESFIAPERTYRVQANPGMFDAQFRGQQALAQGVSDVASVAGQYAVRMSNANMVAKSAELDKNLKTAWTEYQKVIDTSRKDPETWVKGWDEVSSKVVEKADKKGLTGPQLARMNAQASQFSTDARLQISSQAEKQRIENGQTAILSSANLDLQNGDFDGYVRKINEGAEVGFFDPKQQQTLMDVGRKQFDFEQANKAINDDPFIAYDLLEAKTPTGRWQNYHNLDENRRLSLTREAQVAISKDRAETVQGIVARQEQGEIITEAELDSLVETKRLLPTQKKWVQQEQSRRGRAINQNADYAQLLRDIDQWEPAQDPTRTKESELIGRQLQFPSELRGYLMQQIKDRKTTTHTEKKEAYDYIDKLTDGGFLGNITMTTTEDSKTGARTTRPTNAKEYQQAYGLGIQLRQEIDQFLQKNPKATPVEQMRFIDE